MMRKKLGNLFKIKRNVIIEEEYKDDISIESFSIEISSINEIFKRY